MSDKEYDELLRSKQYQKLGWYFWNSFLLSKGTQREIAVKRYDSLTNRQQKLCERI